MSETTESGGRANRRRYLRYLDSTVQVRLRRTGLLGRFRAEARPMIDFNRYGLAFVHDARLALGEELRIDVDARSLSLTGLHAIVRVCAAHPDGLRIGVEFLTDGLRRAAAEKLTQDLHELEKALKRR